jgi:hypothetical protein
LLSREPFIEYPYVRAAKDKLDEIRYDYTQSWVKSGLKCGFDAAKTLDEVMIGKFNSEPDWNKYGSTNKPNNNAIRNTFFGGIEMPYGFLPDSLSWSYEEW